ncbi:hypothetical protein HBI37_183610 [Parastagonospora nodorum]|nr:hypothetical protein HBI37_183610 [Parastagonospora nodorum]KAH6341986.1 hypothetical protein HBI36_184730 [Parastagonospora nodorum]
MTDSLRARTLINSSAVLYEQSAARPSLPAEVSNIDLDFVPGVAFIPDVHMADSLRARTLINLSAVLYEQAAARTGLSAKVGNIDLDFVPSVAFIPDVYMADSLRARTLINLSAVLYEQAAARTGLPAEVGNISLRARTLINLSAVLYEQVGIIDLDFVPSVAFDAIENVELTGDLPGNADRVNNNNNNVAPTPQFSLTALLNLRSLASKRPASSSSDLDRGRTDPTIAGQISLVKQLHNRIKTDEDRKKSTHRQGFNSGSSLELQKTSSQAPSQTGLLINLTISDDNDVQLVGDNIEELICVGKVKHTYVQAYTVPYPDLKKYLGNSGQQGRIKVSFRRAGNNRNNLNIIVTNPTGREFSRVDMKSSTGLCLLIDGAKANGLIWIAWTDIRRKQASEGPLGLPFLGLISMTLYIYVLRSVDEIRADVADVFDTVVSKSDKVPTRELSSYIKTELLRDNSRKFYRLVITGEDTHCKQIIKKAYIMSPERALLILFMT